MGASAYQQQQKQYRQGTIVWFIYCGISTLIADAIDRRRDRQRRRANIGNTEERMAQRAQDGRVVLSTRRPDHFGRWEHQFGSPSFKLAYRLSRKKLRAFWDLTKVIVFRRRSKQRSVAWGFGGVIDDYGRMP